MKKMIIVLFAMMMLAGCTSTSTPATTPENSTETNETVTNVTYKAGLGVSASLTGTDATEDDGYVKVMASLASVVLDQDGRFVYAQLDALEQNGYFNSDGEFIVDSSTPVLSKDELGSDYGMSDISGISKEWFEQADAFEEFLIGKTLEEAMAVELNETGAPTSSDLVSSVSISVSDFLVAVDKAVNNAVEVNEASAYKTAISLYVTGSNASQETEGKVEISITSALVGLTEDEVIVFSLIDTAQNYGYYSNTGVYNTETSVVMPTKKEKGEEYGMAEYSGISKEWDQQVIAFEEYTVGKTVGEVVSSMGEDTKTTDADLISSTTISISPFVEVFNKLD